jgi:hypothetical protein
MWSFGVILFLLLSGDAPFKDPNVKVRAARACVFVLLAGHVGVAVVAIATRSNMLISAVFIT